RLRGRTRPGPRGRPAGRHHGDRGGPGPLRRGPRGRERRQRPADPAGQDPVLRVQVLPHLHPDRAVADPGRRGRPGPAGLAAAEPVGERRGPAGQHHRGHDRPARAGTDPAVPVPADGPGRPAADRHARRHRAKGTGQDRRAGRRAAAARHPVEAVLQAAGGQPPLPARRRRHHRDDRLPRRAARPRHPAHHRYQEDAMTTPETLPLPTSTYQLLLDAARAWPDGIATQWIPDPADHTRCLDWTYAELAGTVTRIANALTALGVGRGDAVTLSSASTSTLYAATLAAQAVGIAAPVNPALSSERITELVRRTGSRVLVAAGPELDPQLWPRLLEVARQAGMTAVLALRPDGAHGDPPVLGPAGDGGPDGRPLTVAYLDEVISGQPSGHLAGADLPKAGDLAAFVHTGGTTGAPKVAAHTHANELACG